MNNEQIVSFAEFRKRSKANVIVPKKAPPVHESQSNSKNACGSIPRPPNCSRPEDGSTKARFAILAKIIRYLRYRHLNDEDHFLSIDEIFDEIHQPEVRASTKNWLLTEALVNNPKIEFIRVKNVFRFKPKYRIRDGKALIRLLKQQDLKGLGGVDLEDIKESLPKYDACLKKHNSEILTITRPRDRNKVLFYNDKSADFHVDEEFKRMWRMVPVDNLEQTKIEEHLEKQGIRTLKGEKPKIMVQKHSRGYSKRKRSIEKSKDNVHVADVLQNYDCDGLSKVN